MRAKHRPSLLFYITAIAIINSNVIADNSTSTDDAINSFVQYMCTQMKAKYDYVNDRATIDQFLKINQIDYDLTIDDKNYQNIGLEIISSKLPKEITNCQEVITSSKQTSGDNNSSQNQEPPFLRSITFIFKNIIPFTSPIGFMKSDRYLIRSIKDKLTIKDCNFQVKSTKKNKYNFRKILQKQYSIWVPKSFEFTEELIEILFEFDDKDSCNLEELETNLMIKDYQEDDDGITGKVQININYGDSQRNSNSSQPIINQLYLIRNEFDNKLATHICKKNGYRKAMFSRRDLIDTTSNSQDKVYSFSMKKNPKCESIFEKILKENKLQSLHEVDAAHADLTSGCVKQIKYKNALAISCKDQMTMSASLVTQSPECFASTRCSPGLDIRSNGEDDNNLCLPNRCFCDYGKPPEIPFNLMQDFCGLNFEEEKKLTVLEDFRDDRMYGGEVVTDKTKWPFVTQIFETTERTSYLCGGAIISPNFIVTAAHCFYTASSNGDDLKIDTVYVTKLFSVSENIYMHEDYNQESHENDIAIVRLIRSLEMNKNYRPICIFMENTDDSSDFSGFEGKIVTINGDEDMKSASFDILETDNCYDSDDSRTKIDKTMCVVSSDENTPGANTCKGDSGSPLLFESKILLNNKILSRWYLLGVVSGVMGFQDCEISSKKNVVLTNIPAYRNWINETIHNNIADKAITSYCANDQEFQCSSCEDGFKLEGTNCVREIGEREISTFHSFFTRNFCGEECHQFMKCDVRSDSANHQIGDQNGLALRSGVVKYNNCKCDYGDPSIRCETEELEFCASCRENTSVKSETILCHKCVGSICYYSPLTSRDELQVKLSNCVTGQSFTRTYCLPDDSNQAILNFDICERNYHFNVETNRCQRNTCNCEFGKPNFDTNCQENNAHSCRECDAEAKPIAINGFIQCHKKCYCDNGTPISDINCDRHNTHHCTNCDDYYHLNNDIQAKCVANIGFCDRGEVHTGYCISDGGKNCCKPDGCNALYHYNQTSHQCHPNVCVCDNGSTIEECHTHNFNHCESCMEGYNLSDTNECIAKQCSCANGTPALAVLCPSDGDQKCASCDEGYYLNSEICTLSCGKFKHYNETMNLCEDNICLCEFGTPETYCYEHNAHSCELDSCFEYARQFRGEKGFVECRNKCICPNGTPISDDLCPGFDEEKCSDCNVNYLRNEDYLCESTCPEYWGLNSQNSTCIKNICQCEGDLPRSDCPQHGQYLCECLGNHHFDIDTQKCVQNVCECEFGTPVENDNCIKHGAQSCVLNSCHDGAAMWIAEEDVIECNKKCICPNGKAVPDSECPKYSETRCIEDSCVYYHHFNVTTFSCDRNECVCPNGNSPYNCPKDGELLCEGCGEFYHLSEATSECEINECVCNSGQKSTECPAHDKELYKYLSYNEEDFTVTLGSDKKSIVLQRNNNGEDWSKGHAILSVPNITYFQIENLSGSNIGMHGWSGHEVINPAWTSYFRFWNDKPILSMGLYSHNGKLYGYRETKTEVNAVFNGAHTSIQTWGNSPKHSSANDFKFTDKNEKITVRRNNEKVIWDAWTRTFYYGQYKSNKHIYAYPHGYKGELYPAVNVQTPGRKVKIFGIKFGC